jgi:hypothetical protein
MSCTNDPLSAPILRTLSIASVFLFAACALPTAEEEDDVEVTEQSATATPWTFEKRHMGRPSDSTVVPYSPTHIDIGVAHLGDQPIVLMNGARAGRMGNYSHSVEVVGEGEAARLARSVPAAVSVAVGPDGTAHTAWESDGAIYHATRTAAGRWRTERIDSPELYIVNRLPQGQRLGAPCIVVEPDGTPHVSYTVGTTALVDVVAHEGEWDLRVFYRNPSRESFGQVACMAGGPSAPVQFAFTTQRSDFYGDRSTLWHANGVGEVERIDGATVIRNVAASAAPDGSPSIAWISGRSVRLATRERSGWSLSSLDRVDSRGAIGALSLAHGPDGNRYAAYMKSPHSRAPGEVHMRRELAGRFVDYVVDKPSAYPTSTSISVAPNGKPVVAWAVRDRRLEKIEAWIATAR